MNVRLVWRLESLNMLVPQQYGFRKGRSTVDVLAGLDTAIKTAFAEKRHLLAVFFDLEKAYDTAWRHGILQNLFNAGIRGLMGLFIQFFLSNRTFKVKLGSIVSSLYPQHEGVPQGSVLSCTLFALAINNITSCLPDSVRCTLYVDDFAVYASSAHLPILERRMQLTVNRLCSWSVGRGFKFSPSKSAVMHFTKLRGAFPPPQLSLGNSLLRSVTEVRFLGMILDTKLSWLPHLKNLKAQCLRAMNILKVLSRTSWGADRLTLLRIYRALIRSKLDYGCQLYSSAPTSTLRILDPVHNLGVRLSLGAFRTSPVESLYAESGEPSLHVRRQKLSLQLYARLMGMPRSPVGLMVLNASNDGLFDRPRIHSTFGCRMRRLLDSSCLLSSPVSPTVAYLEPPWTLPINPLCSGLRDIPKSSVYPPHLKSLFLDHLQSHHCDEVPIYTDGSKDGERVSYAAILPSHSFGRVLPPSASIFSAELYGILTALAHTPKYDSRQFVVFSDSCSALEAICNCFSAHPVVREIHRWIRILARSGKTVKLCWVPGHVGIDGNEQADTYARSLTSGSNPATARPLPAKDFYPSIRSYLLEQWQRNWTAIQHNKLRCIKDTIGPWGTSYHSHRRREVLLARLRIGHCRITHQHLLLGEPPPYCGGCVVPLTVDHILTECPEFDGQRTRAFGLHRTRPCLRDLLSDDSETLSATLSFLRDIAVIGSL